MTHTATYPLVPLPPGADHPDVWEDVGTGRPFRLVYGPVREIEDKVVVQTSPCQYADGSIDTAGDPPYVNIEIHGFDTLTSKQARALAGVLVEATGEIDGWVQR